MSCCGVPAMNICDFEHWPEHAAVLMHRPNGVTVRLVQERIDALLSCPRGPSSCIVRATDMAVADGLTVGECVNAIKEWSVQPLDDRCFGVYLGCLKDIDM